MDEEVANKKEAYEMFPAWYVRRQGKSINLEILEPYCLALKQLDHFSHVMVFWRADKHDNDKSRSALLTRPTYAKDKLTGVFATRTEYRPNPIAMTTCKILKIDENNGIIQVADTDAFDGTLIVDLKAYHPVCDRVKDAEIPEWLSDWPEWMPEEGIGL